MPIICFASPKGGAGKTTAAMILATQIAKNEIGVTVIDCDPRQWCVRWGEGGKTGNYLNILPKPTEDTIIDAIDQAQDDTPFVIIDLEGTSSMLVAFAISRSDLVIIPTQPGPMEGDSAADAVKLIKQQEKSLRRQIPFAVLMTRMSNVIRSKIEKDLMGQMTLANITVFETLLIERNAFRAMFAYKCPLDELPNSTYKLDDAIANAKAFAGEVVARVKALKSFSENREVET